MYDFFKNNPIALRHCVLYVFLQKQSVEKAYNDFCEAVGTVIKKRAFRYWFKQFEKGKFDDNEQPIPDIREIIRNDKQALRVCVMYECFSAKRQQAVDRIKYSIENEPLPVFIRYIYFCIAIGDDVMEYREFDFYFYRFLNEKSIDLNFERDEDKKIYELMDMPIVIMRNIVKRLGILDRLSLEKTSRSLHSFSQEQKLFQGSLTLSEDYHSSARIFFEEPTFISYKNEGNDCVKMSRRSRSRKVIPGVTYSEKVLQDFKKILENPKLHVKTLTFSSSCQESKSLGRYIGDALKFTHLLRVEHISIHAKSMNPLLNILPYLKPGYLTTITININSDEVVIEKVVEMDQWKQAKYFHMRSNRFIGPLLHFYHFKEFDVRLMELSVEDVREMKEILLKSPDFEGCTLFLQSSVDPIVILQLFRGPIDGSNEICHYPIPNSADYFEIIVRNDFFKISKQKK